MERLCLVFPIAVSLVVIVFLTAKIFAVRRSLREISEQFKEKIEMGTNTLIDISSGDKALRHLANELNRELARLRKMKLRYERGDLELKQSITNISHDLRTPLTAICGYLDLLEKEENSENARRYITVIRERTDTLTEYTQELLRYSIITDPVKVLRPKCVSLNAALEECLAAMYGAFTARGIAPSISMPEAPVVRELDPTALERVLNNILTNALKHSDGDLSIVLREDGTLIFSNSTIDLTPMDVERLFDRFYTVSSARNSTGLGLSIAKVLTGQMGGTISASCQNGRFDLTVSFPGPP